MRGVDDRRDDFAGARLEWMSVIEADSLAGVVQSGSARLPAGDGLHTARAHGMGVRSQGLKITPA